MDRVQSEARGPGSLVDTIHTNQPPGAPGPGGERQSINLEGRERTFSALPLWDWELLTSPVLVLLPLHLQGSEKNT